jgi:hypothetical protein
MAGTSVLVILNAFLGILGGILAASGFIVSKRPDAQRYIDRLAPFEALIGLGLIFIGLINFVKSLKGLLDFFKVNLFSAASVLTLIAVSILLGLLFSGPQLMKLFSGNPPPPTNNPYALQYQQMMMQQNPGWRPPQPSNAAQKFVELQQKIAPFRVMIGLLAIIAALITLLYQFHIIKYSGGDPI